MGSDNVIKNSRMILGPEPRNLVSAREFIRATLEGHVELIPLTDDLIFATHEACKNAIMHNASCRSPVEINCEIRADAVVVEVRDRGQGMKGVRLPPTPPDPEVDAGRGLHIIYCLMDKVDVETGRHGTRIRMEKIRRSI